MNSNTGNIHSIETFGAFDGPGLRFVIFFQGCNKACLYCHNRDTWALTDAKIMHVDELVQIYEKYAKFYNGGVTLTGGEPLLQLDFLLSLTKELKKHNCHIVLETTGVSNPNNLLLHELLSNVDIVIFGIKDIDQKIIPPHLMSTSFLDLLNKLNKHTILRYVLLPTINDSSNHIMILKNLQKKYANIKELQILPYHKKGVFKWESLGFEYKYHNIIPPTNKELKQFIKKTQK